MNTETTRKAPRVLITRPAGQHIDFAQQCRSLGFKVSLLPCIAIEPVSVSIERIEQQRITHEITLFTSTNAVRFTNLITALPWPDTQVHAIGAATARHLATLGQSLSLTPRAPYSSEAYLEQMRQRNERRLLIIKGVGGREMIADQLGRAGWTVTALEIYKRVPTQFKPRYINQLLSVHTPDVISVTSDEILTNLWRLCAGHHDTLRKITLIVNSCRCAQLARQLGFINTALVAQPAGDAGQLACLQEWLARFYR